VAEIFPNEGLTHLIEVIPRSNTGTFAVPTALYMGLFSSQTASTVPSADATLTGSATTPYTAALQAAWPAPVINGAGMRSTMVSPGISFAESTGAFNATVNGFFIANAASSTGQNTGKTFAYANFSDTTAVTVNAAGYTIRIAAFWHLDG
jgi:hypothetical protein